MGDCHTVGFIYFAKATDLDLVKIGWTARLVSRLDALRTLCPSRIALIGLAAGRLRDEALWHHRLGRYRKIGEWFDDASGAVSEAVARAGLMSAADAPHFPASASAGRHAGLARRCEFCAGDHLLGACPKTRAVIAAFDSKRTARDAVTRGLLVEAVPRGQRARKAA